MTTHATARWVRLVANRLGGVPYAQMMPMPPAATRACDLRRDPSLVSSGPTFTCPHCLVLIDAALEGRFLVGRFLVGRP